MLDYSWLMANREIMKIVFTIATALICLFIVFRTHKIYQLSYHEGIRYFRNAFFFYFLATLTRYFIGICPMMFPGGILAFIATMILFEFFIIMAGFFLLYSLLCKNFEREKHSFSSLFNARIFLFYTLAAIISIIDFLWGVYYFMYFSQILVFSFASGVAYAKYSMSEKKSGFLKLYLMVILLNLAAWIINFIVASFFEWHVLGVVGVYAINTLVFLLFLYDILKVTRK